MFAIDFRFKNIHIEILEQAATVVQITFGRLQECYYSLNGNSKLGGALCIFEEKYLSDCTTLFNCELLIRLMSENLEVVGSGIVPDVGLHNSQPHSTMAAPFLQYVATNIVGVDVFCDGYEGPRVRVAKLHIQISLFKTCKAFVPVNTCLHKSTKGTDYMVPLVIPQEKHYVKFGQESDEEAESSADSVDLFITEFNSRFPVPTHSRSNGPLPVAQLEEKWTVYNKTRKNSTAGLLFRERVAGNISFESAPTNFDALNADQRSADDLAYLSGTSVRSSTRF